MSWQHTETAAVSDPLYTTHSSKTAWARSQQRQKGRKTQLIHGGGLSFHGEYMPTADLTMKRLMALSLGMALAVDAHLQTRHGGVPTRYKNAQWTGALRYRNCKGSRNKWGRVSTNIMRPRRRIEPSHRKRGTINTAHCTGDTIHPALPPPEKAGALAPKCATAHRCFRGAGRLHTIHADPGNAPKASLPKGGACQFVQRRLDDLSRLVSRAASVSTQRCRWVMFM